MSRNTILALVALLGVLVLGGGGTYWAYKKMKAERNKEFRYEGKIPIWNGFDEVVFRDGLTNDDVLDEVIKKYELVEFWDVSDAAEAKVMIRGNLHVKVEGQYVHLTYQDRDKTIAQGVLKELVASFQKKVNESASSLPRSSAPMPNGAH